MADHPALIHLRLAVNELIALDLAGIAVSAGSACSSGSLRPSAVLAAMGWGETEAREVIRVRLAPETCEADIARFLSAWTRSEVPSSFWT